MVGSQLVSKVMMAKKDMNAILSFMGLMMCKDTKSLLYLQEVDNEVMVAFWNATS